MGWSGRAWSGRVGTRAGSPGAGGPGKCFFQEPTAFSGSVFSGKSELFQGISSGIATLLLQNAPDLGLAQRGAGKLDWGEVAQAAQAVSSAGGTVRICRDLHRLEAA